jgi:galactonate dehydratase
MKITSVEIFDINLDGDLSPIFHPIIVRINTDENISGIGEAGLAYGVGHSAAAGMVKNLAERFLIGTDPFKIEQIWNCMLTDSFWARGGGPVVFGGMSAIDIALWDIKGKALNLPVYQLLGGKTNDNLRTYASQIQFGWDKRLKALTKPEQYAAEARKAVEEGYDCIKIDPVLFNDDGKFGNSLTGVLTNTLVKKYYERVRAVREAVGPDVDIMLELHSIPSTSVAIQLGRVWEEFNLMCYEEPVNYLNVDLQCRVTREVKIPMAAGERLYTRWGYRQYFEKQAIDIIQPDLGLVGGITEGKKVCDYAHIYDITVQAHVCGSPVATAAALQLEAVIPNFLIHEHHSWALKEANIRLCKQDYQPVNGKFKVPDLPGIGIELNDNDKQVTESPRIVVK